MQIQSSIAQRIGLGLYDRPRVFPFTAPARSTGFHGASFSANALSASEMRHNFAIWARSDPLTSCRFHIYYCVRCKWSFKVHNRRPLVAALDGNGNEIHGTEADKRLATFSVGPCPAFASLMPGPRHERKVTPITRSRGRLAAVRLAIERLLTLGVGSFSSLLRPSQDRPNRKE